MNGKIVTILENLATQDSRATRDPIFVVERKLVIYGVDEDMADEVVWVRSWAPYDQATPEKAAKLDKKWGHSSESPKKWRRTGVVTAWVFVTSCLTEQGCVDYLAANGPYLGETRVYVYSAYLNAEVIALREYLLQAKEFGYAC